MPKGNKVVVVGKRDDPFRIVFRYGEQTFDDIADAFADFCVKIVQYDVRVRFRHRCGRRIEIMPHDGVAYTKVRRGTQRQMADDQSVGFPTSFLDDDYIRKFRLTARFDHFIDSIVPSIDPRRIRNEQFDFFRKLFQSRRRIP